MATNADYTNEYFDIIDDLDGAIEDRRASYDYMKASTAIVHHQVVACSFVPRLFNQKTYDVMKHASEMTHSILCKVMQRYLDDPEYRNLFDFDDRLQKLILIPRRYDALLPFARIDTFLNEDTYQVHFCEFNGDGSAGMNENREITNSIKGSQTFKTFMQDHKVEGCNLFDAWVDKFIEIYSTFENKVENPTFAICDYLQNGVVDEFHIYAKLFEDRGYRCLVRDVCELRYDGEILMDAEGNRIDAIWRRCVTNDVLEFWDQSQDLIRAVEAGCVALIGSFAGHIVHDKQIFEVLMKQETIDMLDADEISFLEQAIPQTDFLNDDCVNIQQIKENKDEWIIKPSDHYGADNVYAGLEQTQEEWVALIDEFANDAAGYPFIVQRYIRPFKTKTLPPDTDIDELPDGAVEWDPVMYNNLNGLYLYDGHFQGVFSRLGPYPTISKQNGGMTSATIWVDADVDCGISLD